MISVYELHTRQLFCLLMVLISLSLILYPIPLKEVVGLTHNNNTNNQNLPRVEINTITINRGGEEEITGIELDSQTNKVYVTTYNNETKLESIRVVESVTRQIISTIPSARCPSVSDNGSLIAYYKEDWPGNQELGVNKKEEAAGIITIASVENDSRNFTELVTINSDECPFLSDDGSKVAYARHEKVLYGNGFERQYLSILRYLLARDSLEV